VVLPVAPAHDTDEEGTALSPARCARELVDLFTDSPEELDHVDAAHYLERTRADGPTPGTPTAPVEPGGELRGAAGGEEDKAAPPPDRRYGKFQEAVSNLFGGQLPPLPPPPAGPVSIERAKDTLSAAASAVGTTPTVVPATQALRRAAAFAWWDAYRAIARQWLLDPFGTASGGESVDTEHEYDAADVELKQCGWTDDEIAQWGFRARYRRGPAPTS